MNKVEKGQNVKVHYKGTFQDGREFDNSHKRGNPINFKVGGGNVIRGFESAVLGMTEGQTKSITLGPEMAYGPVNPDAFIEVPKEKFPDDFNFVKNGYVRSRRPDGRPVFGKITEVKEETVVLDVNHPMAGQELNFEIKLVEIEAEAAEVEEKEAKPKKPKKPPKRKKEKSD